MINSVYKIQYGIQCVMQCQYEKVKVKKLFNLLKRVIKLVILLSFRVGDCLTEFLFMLLLLWIGEDDSYFDEDEYDD